MKLKFIDINGFGVLVDENAEVNFDTLVCDTQKNSNEIYKSKGYWKGDKETGIYKIICAEKELNLDLPILPNFKDWEIEQLAINEANKKTFLTFDKRDKAIEHKYYKEGFIAGYNHNKAKWTDEDLELTVKELIRAINKNNEVAKPSNFVWTDWFKIHKQLLQKTPQFIEIESECCGRCIEGIDECITSLKLVTNSDGKQEVIIKEIIYE